MTLHTNHGPPDPEAPFTVEDYVAREHWRPVGESLLFQAVVLVGTAALFAVPPAAALSLVHIMGLLGAVVGTVVATGLADRGERERATLVATRALASLLLSGGGLAGLLFLLAGQPPAA